jgi:hypothetical protein
VNPLRNGVAVVLVGVAVALVVAAPAPGHAGNPNFSSQVRDVAPRIRGLQVNVLNGDDRFELINNTGRDVTIYGYNGEPYARLLANGSVQTNARSPATYLNTERLAGAKVPATANPKAPPQWTVVDKTGRFQWHDHRMHWMAKGTPAAVKDESKRTKVFDYRVPLRVGARAGAIDGSLYWVGSTGAGVPGWAWPVVALALVATIGLSVTLMRRRMRQASAAPAQGEPGAKEVW